MNNHITKGLNSVHSQTLGVVLAGGLSSRMGSNKAELIREHGPSKFSSTQEHSHVQHSMLEFSQQLLKNCYVDDVVISSQHAQVAKSEFTQNQIPDDFAQLGPLAGIFSVFKARQPKALLILPVDLPLMNAKTLRQLKLAGELSGKATFFNGHFLPLYLPNNAHTELFLVQQFSTKNHSLASGKGPSIKSFLHSIPHQEIPCKNNQALFNCNTPAQWEQAKKILQTNVD